MSALQLYAISEEPARRLPPGARGERLVQIEGAGLVAVAGRASAPPTALEFARVVEGLATTDGAMLPARHDQRFSNEETLRAAVVASARRLHEALEHVRGCVELGVSAAFRTRAPEPAGATGRDYLMARAASLHLIERLVADVHEPLVRASRDAHLRCGHAPLRFAAAYLVERPVVGEFSRLAAQLASARSDAELVLTGPWAPYSFADLEDKP